MARFRPELRRRLFLLAYALGVAVAILLVPARVTAPARIVFTQAIGPVEHVTFNAAGDAAATAGTLRDAFMRQEQARQLEQELERLRNERLFLRELVLERQRRLRSFEQLKVEGFAFHALSVPVTAYDSSPMHQSITIAAGTRQGVREGLAVCATGAVVGKVIEAGPWRSRARLVTDAASLLSCRVQRTRDLCVLQGTGGVHCSVDWLDRDAAVQQGDVLVTAPMDELVSQRPLIPAGLPVASVTLAEPGGTDPLFQRVTAAPLVNVRRLEVVEVVVPAEGEAP